MSRSCSSDNAGLSSILQGCSKNDMNLDAFTNFSPQNHAHLNLENLDLLAGFIPQATAV
jgi:hypothetical protein